MSTATVESPALDVDLDSTPVCESKDCARPASCTGRLRCNHGSTHLSCEPCRLGVDQLLRDHPGFTCAHCHVDAWIVWRPL